MMRDEHKFIEESNSDLEARLTNQFYRYDCVTPDLLQQYVWGMLTIEAANPIEQHCQHCIECRQTVAQHQGIIQNMATIEVLPEPIMAVESTGSPLIQDAKQKLHQAQVFVAELLDDMRAGVDSALGALAPSPQLAYGALRGEPTERSLLYEAGGAMIDLQLRADQAPMVMISGQVMGLDVEQDTSLSDIMPIGRFRLTPQSNAENEPIVGNLSQYGSFNANEVKPGEYQLTIELPTATYTILDLTVD